MGFKPDLNPLIKSYRYINNTNVYAHRLLQIITKAIRELLQINDIPWNRSIRLPPREQLGKCIITG